jgi:hypothetical protein
VAGKGWWSTPAPRSINRVPRFELGEARGVQEREMVKVNGGARRRAVPRVGVRANYRVQRALGGRLGEGFALPLAHRR